mmetsp:Transcript_13705/g.24075  ORF Transcript_13705/g.24075 Transcript_13705/m.24075 type:complete len:260 (-) Transcript_13705:218-997(-)
MNIAINSITPAIVSNPSEIASAIFATRALATNTINNSPVHPPPAIIATKAREEVISLCKTAPAPSPYLLRLPPLQSTFPLLLQPPLHFKPVATAVLLPTALPTGFAPTNHPAPQLPTSSTIVPPCVHCAQHVATTGRVTPIPAEATSNPTAAPTTIPTLEPIMFAMAMPLLVLSDNSSSSSSSSVVSKSRKCRKSGKGARLSKGSQKPIKRSKSKGRKDSKHQSKSGKSSTGTGDAALLVDYFKLVRGRAERVVWSPAA